MKVREKSFAQGFVIRKMVQLDLEARLTQNCQSQVFCYLSPCASGVTYSGRCVSMCVCSAPSAVWKDMTFVKTLTSEPSLCVEISTKFNYFLSISVNILSMCTI